jgi:hypothetical protein
MPKDPQPQRYKVLIGINYPPGNRQAPHVRAGAGSVIDDLPDQAAVEDLLCMGAITPTDEPLNRIDDHADAMFEALAAAAVKPEV